MLAPDPVARYYDSNTRRFLLVGRAGSSHSIHRQLWGPGVATAEDAADYINRLIKDRIREIGAKPGLTILDMGCGVGGTLFRLAESFPRGQLNGVTISRKQIDIARRLAAQKGLQSRCQFHLGDFQSTKIEVEADVIVAVESFVHAESPARFFGSAVEQLRVGGHLLLADDFLHPDAKALGERPRRYVADFQAGWRVPGLCTPDACRAAAAAVGLDIVGERDLTDLIRLGRPRDRAIALLSPVLRRLGLVDVPFLGNMIGGNALQVGLREGFLKYRFLVFRRGPITLPPAPPPPASPPPGTAR